MPIYEYTCRDCSSKFDKLVRRMSDDEKPACPQCGSRKTDRALSVVSVGSESPRASSAPAPGMCGRCGGPGPCGGG